MSDFAHVRIVVDGIMQLQNRLAELIQSLESDVKMYCQNTKFPLDERWQIFCDSGMGTVDVWIVHWDKFEDKVFRYADRHKAYDMVKYIKDQSEDASKGWSDWTLDELDELREMVLAKWVRRFEYDW